ncbi:MAG: hypothetical protein M0Z50_15710 [Planctomycetia bacterium]|nr:hypothetical protein [Planctomycetia bacterium]
MTKHITKNSAQSPKMRKEGGAPAAESKVSVQQLLVDAALQKRPTQNKANQAVRKGNKK